MKHRAFIALGANIPPKEHYLSEALGKLEADAFVEMIHQSAVYEPLLLDTPIKIIF